MKNIIPVVVMVVMVLLVAAGWWYMKSVFSVADILVSENAPVAKVIKPAEVSKVAEAIKEDLKNLKTYGQVPISVKNIPRASSFPMNSSTLNQ